MKLKKIIAREGLILLGVFLFAYIPAQFTEDGPLNYYAVAVMCLYAFYIIGYRLIFSFAKWAIKTLRRK